MLVLMLVQILGAFEANAFSEHDLRLARERWVASSGGSSSSSSSNNNGNTPVKRKRGEQSAMDVVGGGKDGNEAEARGAERDKDGATSYFGLKYLTSSRLLRLQLRDPTLRLQVLRCLPKTVQHVFLC